MNCPICNLLLSTSEDNEGIYECENKKSVVNHSFTIYYLLNDPNLIEDYYVEIVAPKFILAVYSYFYDNESNIFLNKETLKFPYIEHCNILDFFNKVRKMHAFL